MPDRGVNDDALRAELAADGFLRRDGDGWRTTPRWQAALARAAFGLQRANAPWLDLRLPIAAALAEHYPERSDEELAALVEALLPVEERELVPALRAFQSVVR